MRFRPEWLRRVLHVPYVPTLGPVHPDALDPGVFDEVITATATGVMLPFDKDRRWSTRKSETVLVDDIVHRPDLTIVPTVSRRGRGTIKAYVYSPAKPDTTALRAATRRWCTAHGAHTGRVVRFHTDTSEHASTTRLLLKDFSTPTPPPTADTVVTDLDVASPQIQDTFTALAERLDEAGFGFLRRRWRELRVDGPILAAVTDEKIIGAIGPLATMTDRQGATVMLPQYFGVLPEHRGRGHGRALWRHAAAWGEHHRAAYQLLQTTAGSPSDRLFRSEGLTPLGFATTVPA
ncbi:GNAT family N-acetyltransferase [Amycolatopsis sp. cmx-11-32]|uniref:GNAT family N-acetyltransferase n=1 Tax=Amycolatopsis sp. cmx-11-32 TaxID=2785796 RepID=UPI0039E2A474